MQEPEKITAYGPAKIEEVISDYADEQDGPITPTDETAEYILEENRNELLNLPFVELMVACHGLTEFYGDAVNDYRASEQESEAMSGFDDWRKGIRCAYPYFIVKGAIHLQMKHQYDVIGRQQTTVKINHWPIETVCQRTALARSLARDRDEDKREVIRDVVARSPIMDMTFPAKVYFMNLVTDEFGLEAYDGWTDTTSRESLTVGRWRRGVTNVTLKDLAVEAILSTW